MGYRKACKILIVTLTSVLLLSLSAAAEGNDSEEPEVIEEVESTTVLFLDKPFSDYTVTEGLLLVISAVCVGRLIYVIARKVMS